MTRAREQATNSLERELLKALTGYKKTWQSVDSELYDLCRRLPGHQRFADVYAKTIVIGRINQARVSSRLHSYHGAEAEVAEELVEQGDLIDRALAELGGQQFDRTAAAQIVSLHGKICKRLQRRTKNLQQPFVSKYLHFHCNIVPIYDSRRASRLIDRRCLMPWEVNWKDATPVCNSMTGAQDWIRAYRNYTAAFIVLWERIKAETSIHASVREIDYLLWKEGEDDDLIARGP